MGNKIPAVQKANSLYLEGTTSTCLPDSVCLGRQQPTRPLKLVAKLTAYELRVTHTGIGRQVCLWAILWEHNQNVDHHMVAYHLKVFNQHLVSDLYMCNSPSIYQPTA